MLKVSLVGSLTLIFLAATVKQVSKINVLEAMECLQLSSWALIWKRESISFCVSITEHEQKICDGGIDGVCIVAHILGPMTALTNDTMLLINNS